MHVGKLPVSHQDPPLDRDARILTPQTPVELLCGVIVERAGYEGISTVLVTFRTKAYADITMFGDVAVRLLGLMGHSGVVPSAIAAEDVPEALRRLRAAVGSQSAADVDTDFGNGGQNDDIDESGRVRVSLRLRALPLIELLEAAARENVAVTWDD
jgi:hypothetical protein